MALTIARVSVGDGETDRALRQVMEEVGVPAGEDWQAIILATRGGAWEVSLEGAPRTKAVHFEWEIVEKDARARYRKLFLGREEQSVDHFKRAFRKLMWECVQFKENPIRNVNPRLGDSFEETVLNLLRYEDMNPVHVRFGIWREGPDGMKFVCKVEYASDRHVPWSWWSALVRTPQDLAVELQRALTARRKRHVAAGVGLRRARRKPASAIAVQVAQPPAAAAPERLGA
jgi:hypothetical protein